MFGFIDAYAIKIKKLISISMHGDRWQPNINSSSTVPFCNVGYFGPRSKQERGYTEGIV